MGKKEIIYNEDNSFIAQSSSIEWNNLCNNSVLITGATGLIGATIVRGIMEYNRLNADNIKLYALVRNREKAEKMFADYMEDSTLSLVEGDINTFDEFLPDVDYIIHGASVTASKDFVTKPVETIMTAIEGTRNILELARRKKVKGMVYMSSMEVYGTPLDEQPLTEERMGYLNPLAVRSSYSESKQMVENLCVAYSSEYQVPVKIIRLTQTFGPGVAADDGRVFAEFARCATMGKDIRLQTIGATQRMYLYTADAATAILTVLTQGKPGSAYNAANMDTYCSIREMADLVAEHFGNKKCNVVLDIPDTPNASYNPICHVYLDCGRLEALGWKARVGLVDMYHRMIECME